MPVLLTGFEPYGGRARNPSEDVVRDLDGRIIAGERVVGRVLPVAFEGLSSRIDRLVDEIAPAIIVSLGLGPGEPVIRIERVAVNVADFDIPDNRGERLSNREVVQGGCPARTSTLPVEEIEGHLLGAGIPARLSLSAGTYLCNACLYTFLDALERKSRKVPCGFIHLPYSTGEAAAILADARSSGRSEAGIASMDLKLMVRAVEISIAAALRSERLEHGQALGAISS
jgi:pyroglutamyl-peptidase